ncbi:hypothetical protein C7448_10237 [Tenacibaculum gallaicum]|uniref:Uncharacterized protein n=1 Tax=Tenacibaculum gallaicum TaxID=561505 RepID=A0A3E0I7A2_9FLAO|nr:hypothetical protein [Tenacibaculum gallaicum]REH54517.1 hypothetical protein C7448_10237 [Tenacibaculum gallaicum]
MKTKNCLLLIIIFISLNLSAQEEKYPKEKSFDIIINNNEIKSNQLLLDFLQRDSRLKDMQISKLIDYQRKNNTSNFENANTRKLKKFGKPSPTVTTIIVDNEVVLGDGINRLYLLDQVRMKNINKITRSNPSFDQEIHIHML